MPKIIKTTGEDEAKVKAGEILTGWINDSKGRNVLLLLSGGSALKILDHIKADGFGPHVTVTMLDDRHTTDSAVSNFLQYKATEFHRSVTEKGVVCYPSVPNDSETLDETASRIDRFLKTWRADNPGGLIIAIVGIGPDGHTAGIMPFADEADEFNRLFVETDRWYTGYDAGSKSPLRERLTATMPFLRRIGKTLVFAVGDVKKRALVDCLGMSRLHEMPGAVIRELPEAVLVTDQEVGL